jgi:NADH dehydrogenase FAD-containing subunit
MTFVLVGAGPTGVELAASLAHMVKVTLRGNFRRIDPAKASIILLDAGSRVLPTFAERLSRRVTRRGRKVKRPFRYFDKGNMAVVGKNYAVLERGWLRTSGFVTFLVWAFVHILCRNCRTAFAYSANGSGRISPVNAARA